MLIGRRDFALLGLAAAAGRTSAQSSGDALADRLRAGRCAVLWRHAQTTPGVGDPPEFQLGVCSTQRNLSEEGRAHARAAGEWFKAHGLRPRTVRSSAWCRCRDTADLAFGAHEVWTPLNSAFGGAGDARGAREAWLAKLRAVPADAFEVWVTHQVNISAFAGEPTAMGEGLVVDAAGKVIGRGSFR